MADEAKKKPAAEEEGRREGSQPRRPPRRRQRPKKKPAAEEAAAKPKAAGARRPPRRAAAKKARREEAPAAKQGGCGQARRAAHRATPAPGTCASPRARRAWSPTRSAACRSRTPRRCCASRPAAPPRTSRKLIDSAAANAENNHDLVADELVITEINVDEGPTLKRYRPRALGRATPIHKRTSHITVALTPEELD